MTRKKVKKPKQYQLDIVKISQQGDGIGYYDEKIIFVKGAMLNEVVIVQRTKNNSKYEKAYVIEVKKPSTERIKPKCKVFNVCGGCALQYMDSDKQLAIKENWLINSLQEQTKIDDYQVLKPLTANTWSYRRKARLGVRFVKKKNKVLVGFREQNSSFITDMKRCEVLHNKIGDNLLALQECLAKLSIKDLIPQIEVAISDEHTVLILRHLEPLTQADKTILLDFGKQYQITWYGQSGGLQTIKPLDKAVDLYYEHIEHNIRINFLAQHFIQINFELNKKMLNQALSLLELNSSDTVLDLFCGLGNFTLPIARYAKQVIGIDLDGDLIEYAKKNAQYNNITNVDFYQADLFSDISKFNWCRNKTYNKALIDPARSGAIAVIEHLAKLGVKHLIYISCNPDTLARDAKHLIELGYNLTKAGIIDMFPHTRHVESIAVFVKR